MAETEDDPWAQLRAASEENAAGAGHLAYSEDARKVAAWRWLLLWVKDGLAEWLAKQLPDASTTLDSTYYLGITRRKGVVGDGVKAVIGATPERRASRIPVVLLGRRVGMPGLVAVATLAVIALAVVRTVLGL